MLLLLLLLGAYCAINVVVSFVICLLDNEEILVNRLQYFFLLCAGLIYSGHCSCLGSILVLCAISCFVAAHYGLQ